MTAAPPPRRIGDDPDAPAYGAHPYMIPFNKHVFVCNGESCSERQSAAVKEKFIQILQERKLLRKGKLRGRYMVTDCSSVGFCLIGPTVIVYPDGIWYAHVQVDDVAEIVDQHLVGGKPVERLVRNKVPAPESEIFPV